MAFGRDDYKAALVLRTIRGTFDFSGRSRRTKVVWWWLASSVVPALGVSAATWLASKEAGRVAGPALAILFLVPMFALLVRRLHDQDRSGWWALALLAVAVLSLPKMIASTSGDVRAQIAAEPHGLLLLVGFVLVFALVAFSIAPETIGPNRFGPDPREERSGEAAEQGAAGLRA
jgi:uncharacterized membrane protein YhaH (DUF805 family)